MILGLESLWEGDTPEALLRAGFAERLSQHLDTGRSASDGLGRT